MNVSYGRAFALAVQEAPAPSPFSACDPSSPPSGTRHVVVKLGARGALLHNADTTLRVRTFKVRRCDATAAGDAFIAAIAASYLATGDIRTALRRAMAAGAPAVTHPGAQPSLPTRREVDGFLLRYAMPAPTNRCSAMRAPFGRIYAFGDNIKSGVIGYKRDSLFDKQSRRKGSG